MNSIPLNLWMVTQANLVDFSRFPLAHPVPFPFSRQSESTCSNGCSKWIQNDLINWMWLYASSFCNSTKIPFARLDAFDPLKDRAMCALTISQMFHARRKSRGKAKRLHLPHSKCFPVYNFALSLSLSHTPNSICSMLLLLLLLIILTKCETSYATRAVKVKV